MAAAKYPAEHSTFSDVPEHEKPDGQVPQDVRVISSPPEVNEPGRHRSHFAASFELKRSSAPQSVQFVAAAADAVPARHGEQDDAPASAYVPAAHSISTLVPAHACPERHSLQLVRVVLLPPEVIQPAEHLVQLPAPAAL